VSHDLKPKLRNCDCADALHYLSDHRGLFIALRLQFKASGKHRKKILPKTRRWKPLLDDEGTPAPYHEFLDQALDDVGVSDIIGITRATVTAAQEGREATDPEPSKHSEFVQRLFAERRAASDGDERKELTKKLWRALRDERTLKHEQRLTQALEANKGAKELLKLVSLPVRSRRVLAMKDCKGHRKTLRSDIAKVFADFYAQLYGVSSAFPQPDIPAETPFEAVTLEEIVQALKQLKSGKACAEDGLLAEMLKAGSEKLHKKIAQAFSLLLEGGTQVPEDWFINKLVVLFKKGDKELPKNYRPISIVPIMAKLFSIVLLNRVRAQLNNLQPYEQAGFRPGYSCNEEVHFLRLLAEKADEWSETLWIASLDLEKAFDKVLRSSVFMALEDAGVEVYILYAIWRIYEQQRAKVSVDRHTVSELFDVVCGVRQGDPLSPLLFNNVTRIIFRDLKSKWMKKRWGTVIGDDSGPRITHAMFADDTLLIASTRASLKQMIKDTKDELAKHGLKLNIDKCQIQTTAPTRLKALAIDGVDIPIVPASQGFTVLGTKFTLRGRTSTEIKSRIAAAWGKFHQIWFILKNRDTSLAKRLRLFDAVVGQSALWCSESWSVTKEERLHIQSVQNEMLRRIAGPKRRPDEDWVEWVIQSTRAARQRAKDAGVRMWVESHLRAKFLWAGHVMRMDDRRLVKRVCTWRDSEWWATEMALPQRLQVHRPHRTHWFRWEDELRRFSHCKGWPSWQNKAQERDRDGRAAIWIDAAEEFVAATW